MYSHPLKVILLSLTGFGNTVLPALLGDPRVRLLAVFTHKYDHPYPYYKETALVDLCAKMRVPCHFGFPVSSAQGIRLLRAYVPDIILIASFREIVKQEVIGIPRLGTVNMHSSLLPKYRGVCPTNAVLLMGEQKTGMTVHYVTTAVDAGDILLQKELPISLDETDCSLRKKFALLAGEITPDIISLFLGERLPRGKPQDKEKETPAPRPRPVEGYLEREHDLCMMERRVRALNPFPGTSLLIGTERVPANRCKWLEGSRSDGICREGNIIEVWKDGRGLGLWFQE